MNILKSCLVFLFLTAISLYFGTINKNYFWGMLCGASTIQLIIVPIGAKVVKKKGKAIDDLCRKIKDDELVLIDKQDD